MSNHNPAASGAVEAGPVIWKFSYVELDELGLELKVKGEVTAMDPKPLLVLFHLLRHAGEIVTKDELAEACWPRRIVTEAVLAKTISRLREVLQDETQAIIRTVHGYGYRLIAPVTIVRETKSAPAGVPLFKAGDRHPLRSDWVLSESLGRGSSGEAWLARHDKSEQLRVFKFPLDLAGLGSLKREITISRLLAESCGPHISHLHSWNLEQEPYFIEYEYVAGGNLAQWAERSGGLANIPLNNRLNVAIQIAQTLAIAHSVGVLHKDLKPSNILVDDLKSGLSIKLADFGSGGVVDPGRLEALGITRLGFTRTTTLSEGNTGTPLYLAPEVLAGQPSTVQGDIYALGVILYQLVAGDFRKPLAPGWELQIDDLMLRDDIAMAAAGDPTRRLSSAHMLAERLQTLEKRRQAHAAELARHIRAEADHRALEKMSIRKRWMGVSIGILLVAIVGVSGLYLQTRQAQIDAVRAAETSHAVATFLGNDVFEAVTKADKPILEWTVPELLKSASEKIDTQFANQPEIAAQLHLSVANASLTLEDLATYKLHIERALELSSGMDGTSLLTIESSAVYAVLAYLDGSLASYVSKNEQLLTRGEARWGSTAPEVMKLMGSVAWGYAVLGDMRKSIPLQRARLSAAMARSDNGLEIAESLRSLGADLALAGELSESTELLRASIDQYSKLPDATPFSMTPVRIALIDVLIQKGQTKDARIELAKVSDVVRRWAPHKAASHILLTTLLDGELLTEEGRPEMAVKVLEPLLEQMAPESGENIDQRWIVWQALGEAQGRGRDYSKAVVAFQEALEASLNTNGPDHPTTAHISVQLAGALLHVNQSAKAKEIIDGISPMALGRLPDSHPVRADLLMVQAELINGNQKDADKLRQRALVMYDQCLGPEHRKSVFARALLAHKADSES